MRKSEESKIIFNNNSEKWTKVNVNTPAPYLCNSLQ